MFFLFSHKNIKYFSFVFSTIKSLHQIHFNFGNMKISMWGLLYLWIISPTNQFLPDPPDNLRTQF